MPAFMHDTVLRSGRVSGSAGRGVLTSPILSELRASFRRAIGGGQNVRGCALPGSLRDRNAHHAFNVRTTVCRTLGGRGMLPVSRVRSSLRPSLMRFVVRRFLGAEGQDRLLVASRCSPLLGAISSLVQGSSV